MSTTTTTTVATWEAACGAEGGADAVGGADAAVEGIEEEAAQHAASEAAFSRQPAPRAALRSHAPAVEVELVDWKTVGSFPSSFVLYLIRVRHGVDVWIIERRYSDFVRLNDQLVAAYQRIEVLEGPAHRVDVLDMLPPKRLSPKLRERAIGLAHYLMYLVSRPEVVRRCVALRRFLGIPARLESPFQSVSVPDAHTKEHTLYTIVVRIDPSWLAEALESQADTDMHFNSAVDASYWMYAVQRRFREFRSLYNRMCKRFNRTGCNPQLEGFPVTAFLNRKDPTEIERRRVALDHFMDIAAHPVYGQAMEMMEFLGIHNHLQNVVQNATNAGDVPAHGPYASLGASLALSSSIPTDL